ncbi:Uncharacterised protein [Neisseria animalis]|nr:Uncharacterised protein [Neisseria animalis]
MIQRCFALPYYVYCLRLRCLVSFLFYSTIFLRIMFLNNVSKNDIEKAGETPYSVSTITISASERAVTLIKVSP